MMMILTHFLKLKIALLVDRLSAVQMAAYELDNKEKEYDKNLWEQAGRAVSPEDLKDQEKRV